MGRLLSEQQPFSHAAPFAGALEYQSHFRKFNDVAVLHGFVRNEGDAWHHTRNHLNEFFRRAEKSKRSRADVQKSAPTNIYDLSFALAQPPPLATELIGPYLSFAETIGKRVAELHRDIRAGLCRSGFSP